MSTTLTYGLKLPTAGDRGAPLFADLEGNINQLDSHNHNGTNSAKIAASSVDSSLVSVPAANWVSQGDGLYDQVVTIPAAFSYDEHKISVRIESTKEYIFPKVEKVAATQVRVWTNDNTETFELVVGG